MSAVKKVLVVGGGIGGQSAAIAFAKAGVEVEIVEILEEYNVYGVGIIQQNNALRALDKIGIADEAMRRGSPYPQEWSHLTEFVLKLEKWFSAKWKLNIWAYPFGVMHLKGIKI